MSHQWTWFLFQAHLHQVANMNLIHSGFTPWHFSGIASEKQEACTHRGEVRSVWSGHAAVSWAGQLAGTSAIACRICCLIAWCLPHCFTISAPVLPSASSVAPRLGRLAESLGAETFAPLMPLSVLGILLALSCHLSRAQINCRPPSCSPINWADQYRSTPAQKVLQIATWNLALLTIHAIMSKIKSPFWWWKF